MKTAAVLGAGVIGLAVAELLSRRGFSVLILEKNQKPGMETSSRNSEVVHAGMYYPTGSLKALLCVQGREMLVDFCARHQVPWRQTGKLIVATEQNEIPALQAIAERAVANRTQPLLAMNQVEIQQKAPNVRGIQALWSTGTGIVDSHALMAKLRQLAERQGADLLLKHEVLEAKKTQHGWQLEVAQPDGSHVQVHADVVVNAAGLWADHVARLVCDDDLPRQVLVKGNYFDIAGLAPADTLVYPVPNPNLVGLGTHLTLDLAGNARLGPDVEMAQHRDDFAVDPLRLETFLTAAQRFLPGLKREHLRPAYAGIRPKLATDRFADFYVQEEAGRGLPGWVNLLGIESPGLTASLAIAERVLALVQ